MAAWRLDVEPADSKSECVYLHVLYPTDVGTESMPECSCHSDGNELLIKVGELQYTFDLPEGLRRH